MNHKHVRSFLALFLSVLMLCSLMPMTVTAAGTTDSDKAANVFVYAGSSSETAVLLKVISFDTLAAMAHGPDRDDPDSHYCQTYIDSMPCPSYKEGVGITIPELLEYVINHTTVENADQLAYTGSDKLHFTSTDNATGNYTYNQLLGVERYAFPALPDYWDPEDYVTDADAVLAAKVETEVYLATSAAGGRILEYSANPSTGKTTLADKIAANDGELMGCLKNDLVSDEAFTLCFGQTISDIENSTATYGNVKKWVYMIRLNEVTTANPITSLGTVAEPTCDFTLDGTTLTITLNCETEGASIYYSTIGGSTTAPLNLYTAPIVIENYDSTQPFTLGYQAVQEGWVSSTKQTKLSSELTESGTDPSFTFTLTGSMQANVGTAGSYGISLTADQDCPLYGAEYRLAFPTASFEMTGVSNLESGWEYGVGTDGDNTVVTFTYLDITGAAGLTANSAINIANLNLTPLQSGTASLAVTSAVVGRQNATAYQNVTAEGMSVVITGSTVVLGDINGDGTINAKDQLRIAKYLKGSLTLTANELIAADVNGDGIINAKDQLRIAKYLRGAAALG